MKGDAMDFETYNKSLMNHIDTSISSLRESVNEKLISHVNENIYKNNQNLEEHKKFREELDSMTDRLVLQEQDSMILLGDERHVGSLKRIEEKIDRIENSYKEKIKILEDQIEVLQEKVEKQELQWAKVLGWSSAVAVLIGVIVEGLRWAVMFTKH